MSLKKCTFIFLLIAISCDNNVSEELPDNRVFDFYTSRFIEEAESRNSNLNNNLGIKIDNLVIQFDNDLENFCGFAISATNIIISTRPRCWETKSDIDREILIFHELGHSILGRPHINTKLPNNDWKSMMFDGNQFGLYQQGSKERNYYLDELFDEETPIPDWAQ